VTEHQTRTKEIHGVKCSFESQLNKVLKFKCGTLHRSWNFQWVSQDVSDDWDSMGCSSAQITSVQWDNMIGQTAGPESSRGRHGRPIVSQMSEASWKNSKLSNDELHIFDLTQRQIYNLERGC